MPASLAALTVLDDTERSCLARYLELLQETLQGELVEVVVFGSVARGERWPAGMPIRSDLDLLVVTEHAVAPDVVAQLVDATLPLFLESGRQLGPQFKTSEALAAPTSEREAGFLADVRRDGVTIYGRRPCATSRRFRQ